MKTIIDFKGQEILIAETPEEQLQLEKKSLKEVKKNLKKRLYKSYKKICQQNEFRRISFGYHI